MPVTYEPNPEQFQGTGTAFIAWERDAQACLGYWDRLPDGPPAPLGQTTPTSSLEQARRVGAEADTPCTHSTSIRSGRVLLGRR